MTSHIAGTIETEGKTLWQLISERALVTPDKRMALDERGRTMTYGEYKNWCERVAAGLSQKGITENTNVSWVLPSKFESLVLTGALSRLGAIQNPILPIYRNREVTFITTQSTCKVLIVPNVFRGFDYFTMAQEVVATLDQDVEIEFNDMHLLLIQMESFL